MGLAGWYERFRQAQLGDWMLYLVDKQGVRTRAKLVTEARQALDFSDNPILWELGVQPQEQVAGALIDESIADLFEHGWLLENARLSLIESGRAYLRQRMRVNQRRC